MGVADAMRSGKNVPSHTVLILRGLSIMLVSEWTYGALLRSRQHSVKCPLVWDLTTDTQRAGNDGFEGDSG